jgi:hypothetical protein
LFRGLISGEIKLPQFANSLQHFVEALIEKDTKKRKTISTRSTSTRFDSHGKVDLRHAVDAIAVLAEGSEPKRVSEQVLDVGPTIRARRLERDAVWRAPLSVVRLIRADSAE